MLHGPKAAWFWVGVFSGVAIPGVLLIIDRAADVASPGLAAVAAIQAIVGMFFAESAFVRAGQSVPLS